MLKIRPKSKHELVTTLGVILPCTSPKADPQLVYVTVRQGQKSGAIFEVTRGQILSVLQVAEVKTGHNSRSVKICMRGEGEQCTKQKEGVAAPLESLTHVTIQSTTITVGQRSATTLLVCARRV